MTFQKVVVGVPIVGVKPEITTTYQINIQRGEMKLPLEGYKTVIGGSVVMALGAYLTIKGDTTNGIMLIGFGCSILGIGGKLESLKDGKP